LQGLAAAQGLQGLAAAQGFAAQGLQGLQAACAGGRTDGPDATKPPRAKPPTTIIGIIVDDSRRLLVEIMIPSR
jgi:hypothetical protein